MTEVRRRGWPIRLQIIALIATIQLLSTGLTVLLFQALLGSVGSPPRSVALELIGPLTTSVMLTRALDADGEDKAISALLASDPRFERVAEAHLLPEDTLWPPGRFYLSAVQDVLGDADGSLLGIVERQVFNHFPLTIGNYGVASQLRGGDWLVFTPSPTAPARLIPVFVLTLVLILLIIPVIASMAWATGTLVAPLKRLAEAADGFSQDLGADDAPEKGSAEVRTAARAFNTMRARLKAMIDGKSYTLAAIGHDLRTPLTRMRLRLEGEGAGDTSALLRDVRVMEVMVDSALSFIRDGETDLVLQHIDLAALAQTVCDDIADLGHDVQFQGSGRVLVHADPALLRRALTNVIENGVTYGTKVVATLDRDDESATATLTVADNGPGLVEAERTAAFEPFWRGDAARGRAEDTGFGLGLSIARTITERHGGTIVLGENAPHGLVVALTLPLGRGHPESVGVGSASDGSTRSRTATQRATLKRSK